MSTHHHIYCQDAKAFFRLPIYEVTWDGIPFCCKYLVIIYRTSHIHAVIQCTPTSIRVTEARKRKTLAEQYNERPTSYAELTNSST